MWTKLLILLALFAIGILVIERIFSLRPSTVFRIFFWFAVLLVGAFVAAVFGENPEMPRWELLRLAAAYLTGWPQVITLVLIGIFWAASWTLRRVGH